MIRLRKYVLAIVLPALLLAGCGSDDDESSSNDTTETTAKAPTGAPILLGVVGEGPSSTPPSPNLPQFVAGATAAAESINRKGGIDGRPLKIVQCDTKADPNVAAECGRKFVSDGVVALVGSGSQVASGFLPITEAAGIPSLGHFSVTPAELAAKSAYPLVSAAPGLLIGQGILAGELKVQKPALVRANLDALAQATPLINMGLGASKLKVLHEVAIPVQAPDMSSYVAAATRNGADSVLALMLPQDFVNFVKALRQAGSQAKVIASSNTVLQALDSGFGKDLEGVYAAGWMIPATETTNPAVKRYLADLDAIDSKEPRHDNSENAWASVHLFATVAADLATIDAKSVTGAVSTLENYDSGLFPPVSFTKTQTLIPGLQLFNTSVLFTEVRDGKFKPLTGEFVDAFKAVTPPAAG